MRWLGRATAQGLDERRVGRGIVTSERVMMMSVIVLQVAILLVLCSRGREPNAVPQKRGSDTIETVDYRSAAEGGGARSESQRLQGGGRAGLLRPPALSAASAEPMERVFDRAWEDLQWVHDLAWFDRGWEWEAVMPTLDMREKSDAYVVVFSLPGVKLSELRVTLDGRLLTVMACPSVVGSGMYRSGIFERRVRLPGPVGDGSRAEALLTNGFLRVYVPKIGGGKAFPGVRRLF